MKKVIIAIVTIVVIAGLCFLGYKLWGPKSTPVETATPVVSETVEPTGEPYPGVTAGDVG